MPEAPTKKVPYGAYIGCPCVTDRQPAPLIVRLGNSGLKVSKIILGCMQYGHKGWQEWVLEEEEAIKHIKYA